MLWLTTALARIRTRGLRVSGWLDRMSRAACIALILFMLVEVIAAVFFRYVLFAPLRWGEELARLVMVWIAMLGIAIALKDGEHLGIETVVGRLRERSRAWCRLISHVLVGVFLVILLYFGLTQALEAWVSVLPALLIPWTWPMLAVPFTAAVQLIHLIPMIADELIVALELER